MPEFVEKLGGLELKKTPCSTAVSPMSSGFTKLALNPEHLKILGQFRFGFLLKSLETPTLWLIIKYHPKARSTKNAFLTEALEMLCILGRTFSDKLQVHYSQQSCVSRILDPPGTVFSVNPR